MTPAFFTMITVVLQFLVTLVVGMCYYMLAMVMTTYDGFSSMILQPFAAVILTTIGIAIIGVADPVNDTLAYYIADSEVPAAKRGEMPNLAHTFMIKVNKKLRNMTVSKADFST